MKSFLIFILIISLFNCTTTKERRGSLSDAFEASESPGGKVPSYKEARIKVDPPQKSRDIKQKNEEKSSKKFSSKINVSKGTYLGTTIGYLIIPLNNYYSEYSEYYSAINLEQDSIILPKYSYTLSKNMDFKSKSHKFEKNKKTEKTKLPLTSDKVEPEKNISGTDKIYFGLGTSYMKPLLGDFEQGLDLKLSIGSINEKYGFLLEAGIGGLSVKEDSSLYDVIKRDSVMRSYLGIELRKHITNTDKHIFWDFIVNTNFTWLHWSFKNELTAADKEVIAHDSLLGLSVGIGTGVCFWNNNNFAAYLDATMNYSLVGTVTNQGFDNDVYEDYIFLKIGCTIMIGVDHNEIFN